MRLSRDAIRWRLNYDTKNVSMRERVQKVVIFYLMALADNICNFTQKWK